MTRRSSRIQAILRDLLVQANDFEKVNRRMNNILARPREKAQRPLAGHKVNSPGQSSDLNWHLAYGFLSDDDDDKWTPCVSAFAKFWIGDVPTSNKKAHLQSAP